MRNYEVTYVADPVLSDSELKGISSTYQDLIKKADCKIVNVDKLGLRQLAYPIKKRTTGIYECIEFQTLGGDIVDQLELALRRDERIMRFLTIALDKFGVKYNDDKRNGLIGKKRTEEKPAAAEKPAAKAAPKPAAKPAPAPVVAEKEAPAPVVAEKEAPAPVVAEKEAPAPVVAEKEAPAPVVAEKEAPAPVVAEKEAPAPVVAEKEAPAPAAEVKTEEE